MNPSLFSPRRATHHGPLSGAAAIPFTTAGEARRPRGVPGLTTGRSSEALRPAKRHRDAAAPARRITGELRTSELIAKGGRVDVHGPSVGPRDPARVYSRFRGVPAMQTHRLHPSLKDFKAVFTLSTPDDFTNSRSE